MNVKAISLFAGAGGCSLGFQKAGYDIIAAFDFSNDAVETYNLNFGESKSKVSDLSNCDFKKIRKELKLNKGEIDLIIGGPPCQGFSSAGIKFWDDDRNKLLKNYADALEEFQPKFFFMENVEGILTAAKGQYIYELTKRFQELGYTIVLEKVYSQEYGIPQRRKRVIIIGNRLGIKFKFPQPTHIASGPIFKQTDVTLATAIEDLEKKEVPEIDHIFKEESELNLRRYDMLNVGQTMKDLPPELQHDSFKKRANRRVKDGTASEKRGGAPSGIKRLDYKEPCLTITSASIREFVHPTVNRTLTLRECARIQTFPDNFKFIGNESSKIQQIANAIPPKLAEIFALHLKELLIAGQRNEVPPVLLSYTLTKANAMSPALKKTDQLLSTLQTEQIVLSL